MNKKLELFKRWFGWDPIKLDEYSSIKFDVKKHFIILSGFCDIKLETRNLAHIKCISIENGDYDDPCMYNITYDIPPQYHAEWEQYMKEKK